MSDKKETPRQELARSKRELAQKRKDIKAGLRGAVVKEFDAQGDLAKIDGREVHAIKRQPVGDAGRVPPNAVPGAQPATGAVEAIIGSGRITPEDFMELDFFNDQVMNFDADEMGGYFSPGIDISVGAIAEAEAIVPSASIGPQINYLGGYTNYLPSRQRIIIKSKSIGELRGENETVESPTQNARTTESIETLYENAPPKTQSTINMLLAFIQAATNKEPSDDVIADVITRCIDKYDRKHLIAELMARFQHHLIYERGWKGKQEDPGGSNQPNVIDNGSDPSNFLSLARRADRALRAIDWSLKNTMDANEYAPTPSMVTPSSSFDRPPIKSNLYDPLKQRPSASALPYNAEDFMDTADPQEEGEPEPPKTTKRKKPESNKTTKRKKPEGPINPIDATGGVLAGWPLAPPAAVVPSVATSGVVETGPDMSLDPGIRFPVDIIEGKYRFVIPEVFTRGKYPRIITDKKYQSLRNKDYIVLNKLLIDDVPYRYDKYWYPIGKGYNRFWIYQPDTLLHPDNKKAEEGRQKGLRAHEPITLKEAAVRIYGTKRAGGIVKGVNTHAKQDALDNQQSDPLYLHEAGYHGAVRKLVGTSHKLEYGDKRGFGTPEGEKYSSVQMMEALAGPGGLTKIPGSKVEAGKPRIQQMLDGIQEKGTFESELKPFIGEGFVRAQFLNNMNPPSLISREPKNEFVRALPGQTAYNPPYTRKKDRVRYFSNQLDQDRYAHRADVPVRQKEYFEINQVVRPIASRPLSVGQLTAHDFLGSTRLGIVDRRNRSEGFKNLK